MKYVKWMIVSLMVFALFGCINPEKNTQQATKTSTATVSDNPPIEVDDKRTDEIDWNISETFESGSYTMRGIPNNVGFIEAPFIEESTKKYMWHFWGDIPDGELTVVALKEGEMNPTPVLVHGSDHVWTYDAPGGPNNGADAHLPSNMMLPQSGKWALLVYLGEEYVDTIVVEVKEKQ